MIINYYNNSDVGYADGDFVIPTLDEKELKSSEMKVEKEILEYEESETI